MSSPEIGLRSSRFEDCAALASLHNCLHEADGADSFDDVRMLQWLSVAKGCWVVSLGDLVVGYTAVFEVPGLSGLLEMQGGIAPAYQRRGLGSALLQYIIEVLRQSSFHTLSYPVEDLDTAVAHFLRQQHFWVEHEEWQMILPTLTNLPPIPANKCHIQTLPRAQAITQFLALYQGSFMGTAWDQPFSLEEMERTFLPSDEILFLSNADGFVGCAWLRFPEVNQAEIEPIGILQGEQGKGYGRILLTNILHKLAQQNIQTVSLGVWANNHKALSLYQSVGFIHTDTVTYLAHSL